MAGACIAEALRECHGDYAFSPRHRRLYQDMEQKLGVSPVKWQNAPGRSKEEVVALLEATEATIR